MKEARIVFSQEFGAWISQIKIDGVWEFSCAWGINRDGRVQDSILDEIARLQYMGYEVKIKD